MSDSTADVLRKARALIERPGIWAKGTDPTPVSPNCVCAQTAISRSAADLPTEAGKQATQFLLRVIDTLATPDISASDLGRIWRWNDAPERTHAEVLAAFDRAIALAEETPQRA